MGYDGALRGDGVDFDHSKDDARRDDEFFVETLIDVFVHDVHQVVGVAEAHDHCHPQTANASPRVPVFIVLLRVVQIISGA